MIDTGQAQGGRVLAGVQGGTGQHVLAAELVLFLGIVGIRAVAQYGPGDKSKLPSDQFGPLFILGNGLAAFFVLSFLAARGGTAAKVAAAGGLLIDMALLLKSSAHLELIANQYAAPRPYAPADESGSYATGQAEVLSPALQYELTTGKLPKPPKGVSAAKSMKYARSALTHYGLSPGQFGDLVKLWTKESDWNNEATNPGSGAYGIAQALPPTKYPKAAQAAGGSNPYDQIDWGLAYIKQTYGSIAAAWAHEQHYGWY